MLILGSFTMFATHSGHRRTHERIHIRGESEANAANTHPLDAYAIGNVLCGCIERSVSGSDRRCCAPPKWNTTSGRVCAVWNGKKDETPSFVYVVQHAARTKHCLTRSQWCSIACRCSAVRISCHTVYISMCTDTYQLLVLNARVFFMFMSCSVSCAACVCCRFLLLLLLLCNFFLSSSVCFQPFMFVSSHACLWVPMSILDFVLFGSVLL